MLILFVDDDNDDFEMFCEACQTLDSNIKCVFKHNGAVAVRYLKDAKELPDYIFLDINMPVMGGVECLKEIKAIDRLRNIPVIIFSTAIDTRTDYKQLGAQAVFKKPMRYDELLKLLHSILNK